MNENYKKIVVCKDDDRYKKDCGEIPEVDYVQYGKSLDMRCSREDYIKYHDYIKIIKDNYLKGDLSPLEKLIIAYDMVRKKQYNRSGDESLDGLPHNVAFNEFINFAISISTYSNCISGFSESLFNTSFFSLEYQL